jgi:hypothetical protein
LTLAIAAKMASRNSKKTKVAVVPAIVMRRTASSIVTLRTIKTDGRSMTQLVILKTFVIYLPAAAQKVDVFGCTLRYQLKQSAIAAIDNQNSVAPYIYVWN